MAKQPKTVKAANYQIKLLTKKIKGLNALKEKLKKKPKKKAKKKPKKKAKKKRR